MKSLKLLIPFLAIFMVLTACQKENISDGQEDMASEQLEQRQKKHPVPFHATYTSEALVLPPQPNAAACGTGSPVFNLLQSGSGNASHLGRISVYISSCINPTTSPPTIFNGEVTFTAANGDLLYFYQVEGAQSSFEIIGGTGRFDDATGNALASFEIIGPGEFINYFDGEIQY